MAMISWQQSYPPPPSPSPSPSPSSTSSPPVFDTESGVPARATAPATSLPLPTSIQALEKQEQPPPSYSYHSQGRMNHNIQKTVGGAAGSANTNVNADGFGLGGGAGAGAGVGAGVEGDVGNKQQLFLSYLSSVNQAAGITPPATAAATADGSTSSINDKNANSKTSSHFGIGMFASGGGERSLLQSPSSLLLPTTRSIANSYQRVDERLMVSSAPVAPSSQPSTLRPDTKVAGTSGTVPEQVPSKQQKEQKRSQSKEEKELQQIPGEDGTIRVPSGSGYRVMKPFPWRLHEILEEVQQKGLDWIVSWRADGKSFQVHCQKSFTDIIIPMFFRHSRYKSFQRQLYLYGFRTLETPAMERGCYFHPKFLRNDRSLSRFIVRAKAESTSSSSSNKSRSRSGNGVNGATAGRSSTNGNSSNKSSSKKRKPSSRRSERMDSPGRTVSASDSSWKTSTDPSEDSSIIDPRQTNQAPFTTRIVEQASRVVSNPQSQKINFNESRRMATYHNTFTRPTPFSNGLLGFSDEIISIFGTPGNQMDCSSISSKGGSSDGCHKS